MAIRKRYITPRQKMINLLYVILMAMLAINVSSDVMKGYDVIFRSLEKSTEHSLKENKQVFAEIGELYDNNPVKAGDAMQRAREIRAMADSLCSMSGKSRLMMVEQADGKISASMNIVHAENMEVSYQVMVEQGRGKALANGLDAFRSMVLSVMPEGRKKAAVADCLAMADGMGWENMFSDIPLAGAVSVLAKIQNDVRYAEGEALHALLEGIDPKDFRSNRLTAFVIPESRSVIQGDRYSARIVLAAVDSTQMPQVFIDGRKDPLKGDVLEFASGGVGSHSFSGRIVATDRYGEKHSMPFREQYNVMEPVSTVTAGLMNVLYAGYANPVDVTASGVDPSDINISASGCEVTRERGARFVVKPASSLAGKDAVVVVSGKTRSGKGVRYSHIFHVRALPLPLPFVVTGEGKFSGGKVSKGSLLSSMRVGAAVDDGILDIPYKVLSFDMVFFDNLGNAKVYPTVGERLSEAQFSVIRGIRKNARCYVTSIKAKGPDGKVRQLHSSIEIIIR